jgi:cell fate regulator YaaT (PSP1 superfamily)
MARTAGVRFRQAGKIFYYDAQDFELEVGSYVVVDSAHGLAVGRVVIAPDQVIANEASTASELKPVLRIATDDDVERMEEMKEAASNALGKAKLKASELELDMALANGEFDLDGSQFTAYFSSAERVDFRNLVRDLSRDLGVRVQLLQVGDRDRAKLVDGFDICGERLCCSSWMTNFPSVSIRMAKEQDLPLNPQKISGVCGRLYCCLTFEYEDYKALRGTLPKVGSMISTPAGEARVHAIDFNREVVKLFLLDEQEMVEVAAIDFQLQHGVTIRPMELVRKIEDPLRMPETRIPRPRPERPQGEGRGERPQGGRMPRGGVRPEVPSSGEAPAPEGGSQRRGRRRGRGAGGGAGSGTAPGSTASPQASQPRPAQPRPQQPAPPAGDAAADGAKKRRRRRRGRGRGGPGGGEGAPSSDAS